MTLVEILLLNVNEVLRMILIVMMMVMIMMFLFLIALMMMMMMMMIMMMKVIGRNLLGAVDVGDCIFSHMFGAYFGLSISKVLNFHHDFLEIYPMTPLTPLRAFHTLLNVIVH